MDLKIIIGLILVIAYIKLLRVIINYIKKK